MELVAGHVLYRHGDRTPIRTFPSDPVKETDWPNGFGQLTIVGIEQHHRLGQYLRTRYGSLLSTTYTASEILVRSTDHDRTLMSASANLIGLYPPHNISNATVPIQPVPIHTVQSDDDFLLTGGDCPRYNQILHEVTQSDEAKKLNAYYEVFLKKLQAWTNLTHFTIYNAESIADTVFIEHLYNKAPAWADADVRRNLTIIKDQIFYLHYSTEDGQRIRGGPLIEDIWLNMNRSSHEQPFRKVKMYSAHDSTVSASLAFLGINYPHQPQYASALFVDLYKQNSEYFVRVEYLNVTDSNVAYPYVLDGCSSYECPLDNFRAIYKPRFPGKADLECAIKPPLTRRSHGGHKKLIITLVVLGFIFVFILFLIFFCCHLRQAEGDQPLLSAESR